MVKGAKSVKLLCNGKGSQDQSLVRAPAVAAVQYFNGANFEGERGQQDGLITECRGISGTNPVSSIRFIRDATATTALSNDAASRYAVAFFSEGGCQGQKLGELTGNVADACKQSNGALCRPGAFPKSIMFYHSDPSLRSLNSGSTQISGSFLAGIAAMLAAML
jgi:hypothetical protein